MKRSFKYLLPSLVYLIIYSTSVAEETLPTVKVIGTGCTIAMKVDPKTGAQVPAVSGEDLIASAPGIEKIVKIEVMNFCNIPTSAYMTPEKWVALSKKVEEVLAEEKVGGAVITHGLDTLEETAYFLDLTVKSKKPIVCIGAKKDASPIDTDGPRNLINAAKICVSKEAIGVGVMICLNGQINAAREAEDTITERGESFKSGDFGFLGYVDEDRVTFYRSSLKRQTLPLETKRRHVDIIPMYPGADNRFIKTSLASGVDGLVIQALGIGNVNIPLYEGIREAREKGVPVVISTRTHEGRVRPKYGFKGGSKTLADLGCVFANDLSPQKARVLLMLALGITKETKKLQEIFDR